MNEREKTGYFLIRWNSGAFLIYTEFVFAAHKAHKKYVLEAFRLKLCIINTSVIQD